MNEWMSSTTHTSRQQVQPVGIDGEASDGVQVRHHGVHQLSRVVVVEAYVSVLVRRDRQRQRRVRDDAVDLLAKHRILDPLQRQKQSFLYNPVERLKEVFDLPCPCRAE